MGYDEDSSNTSIIRKKDSIMKKLLALILFGAACVAPNAYAFFGCDDCEAPSYVRYEHCPCDNNHYVSDECC